MRGIINTLQRIGSDIVAGRNIEAYVISVIAVILAIAGVVDDAIPTDWKLAAILAALALLVFQTTRPEKQAADLDSVLHNRQAMGAFHDLIHGTRTLWIYGPSAINVLRDMPFIKREILDHGGKVRVMIQDPESQIGMQILHDQMDKTLDLEKSIQMSLDILANAARWGVEYRLKDYNPGFSMVVIDPDKRNGRVIVEFLGFRNELITDRMHISISREQSQYWFDHWTKQYEALWDSAREL